MHGGAHRLRRTDPPAFRLDMTNVVDKQISPTHQRAIANILAAMFGTPDEPFAMPETGLNQRKLTMAAGPGLERQGGRRSTACIAAIVPTATAFPATATARRPAF